MDRQGKNLTTEPLPLSEIHYFYPYIQVDIFAHDKLLIPIHLGAHWATAVVDFTIKEICYYDSLKPEATSCLDKLK